MPPVDHAARNDRIIDGAGINGIDPGVDQVVPGIKKRTFFRKEECKGGIYIYLLFISLDLAVVGIDGKFRNLIRTEAVFYSQRRFARRCPFFQGIVLIKLRNLRTNNCRQKLKAAPLFDPLNAF